MQSLIDPDILQRKSGVIHYTMDPDLFTQIIKAHTKQKKEFFINETLNNEVFTCPIECFWELGSDIIPATTNNRYFIPPTPEELTSLSPKIIDHVRTTLNWFSKDTGFLFKEALEPIIDPRKENLLFIGTDTTDWSMSPGGETFIPYNVNNCWVSTIVLNPNFFEGTERHFNYVFLHEVFHALGLGHPIVYHLPKYNFYINEVHLTSNLLNKFDYENSLCLIEPTIYDTIMSYTISPIYDNCLEVNHNSTDLAASYKACNYLIPHPPYSPEDIATVKLKGFMPSFNNILFENCTKLDQCLQENPSGKNECFDKNPFYFIKEGNDSFPLKGNEKMLMGFGDRYWKSRCPNQPPLQVELQCSNNENPHSHKIIKIEESKKNLTDENPPSSFASLVDPLWKPFISSFIKTLFKAYFIPQLRKHTFLGWFSERSLEWTCSTMVDLYLYSASLPILTVTQIPRFVRFMLEYSGIKVNDWLFYGIESAFMGYLTRGQSLINSFFSIPGAFEGATAAKDLIDCIGALVKALTNKQSY